jgi:hypothetical protein
MIENSKLIFSYLLEGIIDYFVCSAIALKRLLTTISRMIFIICLPSLIVFTIGILFYATFMILGYFIFLAMISPETAEKVIKDEVIPRVKDKM